MLTTNKKTDLNAIPREELIEVFKETIENHERHIEKFTDPFHDDIMLQLIIIKLKLQRHTKDYSEKPGDVDTNFETEISLVDGVISHLKGLFSQIHPSLLRILPLAKALEIYTKETANNIPMMIAVENRIGGEKGLAFSKQEDINIFRVYLIFLKWFTLKTNEKLTITYDTTENGLSIVFEKATTNNPADVELMASFLDSNFKEIKARLLLLNADIPGTRDWQSGVSLFIPFSLSR